MKNPQNLPQTATAALFTITGGTILVTGMLGIVTTAVSGSGTLSLGSTPTGGTSGPAHIATAATIGGKAIGTMYSPVFTSGVAGAPAINNNSALPGFFPGNFAAITGTIDWTTSTSMTGQMKWFLWFVPIDRSSFVS
jgi:hypothetical protein